MAVPLIVLWLTESVLLCRSLRGMKAEVDVTDSQTCDSSNVPDQEDDIIPSPAAAIPRTVYSPSFLE
jgi:hypothetical protein